MPSQFVAEMLTTIEAGGEQSGPGLCAKNSTNGRAPIVIHRKTSQGAPEVPEHVKNDIEFGRQFKCADLAEAQRKSIHDFSSRIAAGLTGWNNGCPSQCRRMFMYRRPLRGTIASAYMSIATAKPRVLKRLLPAPHPIKGRGKQSLRPLCNEDRRGRYRHERWRVQAIAAMGSVYLLGKKNRPNIIVGPGN